MKFIAVLLAFAGVASAIKQEVFQFPPEKLLTLRKVAAECAAEFNVDPGLISKVGDVNLTTDEASNKFVYCFARKTGSVHEDGHIVVDKIVGLLGDHPLAGAVRDALETCNKITKENPIATVVEMNRCYGETSPVLFEF